MIGLLGFKRHDIYVMMGSGSETIVVAGTERVAAIEAEKVLREKIGKDGAFVPFGIQGRFRDQQARVLSYLQQLRAELLWESRDRQLGVMPND